MLLVQELHKVHRDLRDNPIELTDLSEMEGESAVPPYLKIYVI
jgi:hypothetical protein